MRESTEKVAIEGKNIVKDFQLSQLKCRGKYHAFAFIRRKENA